jgi:hypothetical protein
VFVVLALHAWLALSAMREKSAIVDEMAHLTGGHAIWAKGDYRLQPENGNLPQRWEALPAWLGDVRLPPPEHHGWHQPNVWSLGHAYFNEIGNNLATLLRDGRAMNVLWSLATGVLIFTWTRRLFGASGAWVALLFWCFCPTFLAHGALATSDVCMTFFMLASVGAYWRHLQDFRRGTLLLSAVLLGLAFVAKYSAVLLPIMLAPLAALWIWDDRRISRQPRAGLQTRFGRARAVLGSTIVHLAVIIAVIWLFHGFRFLPNTDPTLVNDYTRPWATVLASIGGPMAAALRFARHFHLLPDAYLYGFAFVVDLAQMRGEFLNGATGFTGWVEFFPYAFLVKTPFAVLAGMVAVVVVIARRWRRMPTAVARDAMRVAPLLSLFIVYWAFSLTSHLNIGQRHLLPTYPVIFIALGALGWATARWSHASRWLVAVLLIGQVAESTSIRPHYLAYFNALAGGPSQGYRHLVDSSLDWGQDLPGLAAWLRNHHLPDAATPVYLAYFGSDDPRYYGIDAIAMVPLLQHPALLPWYRMRPGVYCISATMLSQAYSPIRSSWSDALEKEYQDLRATEPALMDYAAHPERRAEWEKAVSAEKWTQLWERFEQLRFTRFCYYLRAREPDAQIGYSINVYRVTEAELAAAVEGSASRWQAAIQQAQQRRSGRD